MNAPGFMKRLIVPPLLAPEAVVQRQLDAYNARDVDALLVSRNIKYFALHKAVNRPVLRHGQPI